MRRTGVVVFAVAALVAALGGVAAAHPLGNFTTNSAIHVTVSPQRIHVGTVLDLAEIPTVQASAAIDADGDGRRDERELIRWRRQRCENLGTGLRLEVAGEARPLALATARLSFPPGEAGLDTLRLECGHVVDVDLGSDHAATVVQLRDMYDHGSPGWREVTATGDGVALARSDVPAASPTDRLRTYPTEGLNSPLDVRSATLTVQPGTSTAAVATPFGEQVDAVANSFTDLVGRQQLSVWFALGAVATALGLGAVHAVAPGHGKTVMAAYLVGARGGLRDALALGATVAIAHTAGVWILGIAVSASQTLAPERLYPWLTVASGLLFAAVGVQLLRRAMRGRATGHHHDHRAHGHTVHGAHRPDEPHHGAHRPSGADQRVEHGAGLPRRGAHRPSGPHRGAHRPSGPRHGDDHATDPRPLRLRRVLLPGVAGGLVPSPSALVVLLGGIALGRAWFGVVLVVAYGIGMAIALIAAGYALARARQRLDASDGSARAPVRIAMRALPTLTSALVLLGGLVITGRGLLTL